MGCTQTRQAPRYNSTVNPNTGASRVAAPNVNKSAINSPNPLTRSVVINNDKPIVSSQNMNVDIQPGVVSKENAKTLRYEGVIVQPPADSKMNDKEVISNYALENNNVVGANKRIIDPSLLVYDMGQGAYNPSPKIYTFGYGNTSIPVVGTVSQATAY